MVSPIATDSGVARGRLIFFAPSPREPGGAQRRVRLLADALAARGWSVLVIGRTASGARFSLSSEGTVQVLEVPGFGHRRLGAVCFLVSALAIGVAAGIRSHAYLALQLSSPATAAALCGLLTRRPFVVMSSTTGALSEASLLRSGSGAVVRRQLLSRAASLVGQTQEAVEELSAILPGTPAAVLPNPVEPMEAPLLSDTPRVAFSGRLSEEKDLPLLLAVWDRLVSERPDARLTLIGSGSAHRSVEPWLRVEVERRPRLRSSVRFTGWVADPTLELLAADVFAFPSRSEGMSNALLEACALGRVVVASNIPANVAVLGDDYPLLFTTGDETELLRALRTALDDDSIRARCRAQIAQRLSLFSPLKIAERLEMLLVADRARNK